MLRPTRGSGITDVHSAGAGRILALGIGPIFSESLDGGQTWAEETPFGRKHPVRVGLTAEGNPLVGTDNARLFERTPHGWTETAIKGLSRVTSIARTSGATLVAGRILVRRPLGESEWLPTAANPKKLYTTLVAAAGDLLYASLCDTAGRSSLVRSDDHGLTWVEQPVTLPAKVESLSAWGSRAIAVVTGGQAFLTHDRGRTWTSIQLPEYGPYDLGFVAISERAIYSLARSAKDPSLFHSIDDGATWERGEPMPWAATMATSPEGVIYIANGGLVLTVSPR
ncbi:MAG TPA: hypothetical protein VIK91_25045 [Nannocystis sp.]